MEYYTIIKTIEFDLEVGSNTKIVRVELLSSNMNNSKYRAKLMEVTDYNLYPSILNSGQNGEDLHHCHSADRLWKELPVDDEDLYMGYETESEDAALNRAIDAMNSSYGRT